MAGIQGISNYQIPQYQASSNSTQKTNGQTSSDATSQTKKHHHGHHPKIQSSDATTLTASTSTSKATGNTTVQGTPVNQNNAATATSLIGSNLDGLI